MLICKQPLWDKNIALSFALGNILSLGANIINVTLNPSQYLYVILYEFVFPRKRFLPFTDL